MTLRIREKNRAMVIAVALLMLLPPVVWCVTRILGNQPRTVLVGLLAVEAVICILCLAARIRFRERSRQNERAAALAAAIRSEFLLGDSPAAAPPPRRPSSTCTTQ